MNVTMLLGTYPTSTHFITEHIANKLEQICMQLLFKYLLDQIQEFVIFFYVQVFVNAPYPPKKTMHGNCHITGPIRALNVTRLPL